MVDLLLNKNLQIYIVKWLTYWFFSMGFYLLVLKPNGINYINHMYITMPYFLLCAFGGGVLFNNIGELRPTKEFRVQVLLFLSISVLFIFFPPILGRFFHLSEPIKQYLIEQTMQFPLFTLKSSLTKWADLLFQQTLIISLVLKLKKLADSQKDSILFFGTIFFLLHLPLFFILSLSSLFFIIPSVIGGLCFATLILKFEYGIIYSIALHMLFYFSLGIILRFL